MLVVLLSLFGWVFSGRSCPNVLASTVIAVASTSAAGTLRELSRKCDSHATVASRTWFNAVLRPSQSRMRVEVKNRDPF